MGYCICIILYHDWAVKVKPTRDCRRLSWHAI